MRTLVSSRDTRRIAPLSFSFVPIFQASATRIEKPSRSSPSREGMVSTTTCVESEVSSASSFAAIAVSAAEDIISP